MKSTRRPAASARRSTRRPTSSSAPPSIRRSTASCVCLSSPPASIRRRLDRLSRSTPAEDRRLFSRAGLLAPLGPPGFGSGGRAGRVRCPRGDSFAPVAAFPDPIEARSEVDEIGARGIHSARGRAAGRSLAPDAADRGPAATGAKPTACAARRPKRHPRAGNTAPVAFEKLAAFGISRHEGDGAPAPAAGAPPAPVTPLQRPQVLAPADPVRAHPRPQPVRSSVARYEPQGRAIARPPVSEDDHLDIPAFLRRQQN